MRLVSKGERAKGIVGGGGARESVYGGSCD